MTEFSGFWTTGGATGDQQASYSQVQLGTGMEIAAACSGYQGVAPGYLNELAGTVPGANTVRINTGGAFVDGKWHKNDATVDVNIPSAVGGGNTRIDRVVLRVDWSGFIARITRIAGVDAGSPSVPAVTTTPGTTYDILLYRALVNTSGTVTITDERQWALAPLVHRRQGGNATNWNTTGTTTYTPDRSRMQVGSALINPGNYTTITFPVAFSAVPLVFCQVVYGSGAFMALAIDVTAATFAIGAGDAAGAAVDNATVFWLAVGPA